MSSGHLPGPPTVLVMSSRPKSSNAWLKQVQALFAKAESTAFPDEAEAFIAKAQQVMATHSIDQAMLDAAAGADQDPIESETVVCVAPYASSKSLLLSAVATANHVRAVRVSATGDAHIVIVGHRNDLEHTKTLFAALSLHAVRTMLAEPIPPYETPRRFRHAFMVAFASRISLRLKEATRAAEAAYQQATGTEVGLVLVERQADVDTHLAELFPRLTKRRVSLSSGAGAESGWSAGGRADLGHQGLAGSRPALGSGR